MDSVLGLGPSVLVPSSGKNFVFHNTVSDCDGEGAPPLE